ncbi:MAG: hypothetical protein HFI34_09800 [Lachnospiraceae bacterium]|nr:hypothetical protein [Lachnospiraceae bacterium]
MRIKKVNSDAIKLYETSQVKFKIAGKHQRIESKFNSSEVQNSNCCPIQNISKNKYLDKQTGEIKERKKSLN